MLIQTVLESRYDHSKPKTDWLNTIIRKYQLTNLHVNWRLFGITTKRHAKGLKSRVETFKLQSLEPSITRLNSILTSFHGSYKRSQDIL